MFNKKNYDKDKDYQDFVKMSPDLSELSRRVLYNRLDNYKDYKKFIYNYYGIAKDIDKLKDIDKASLLINKWLDNPDTHYALVCDYDSDGINSGVVQFLMLTTVFGISLENISVFVNKRKTGNGFSKTLVNRLKERNEERHIDLIISSDHGSQDENSFKILKELNIEMVITDHHEINYNNYPVSATVFVNNQRNDSAYSKDISGCFVVFLVLLKTYMDRYKTNDMDKIKHILPYVAITTITDVMSLKDPINRLAIRLGLNSINSYKDRFWLFLASTININKRYVSKHMGFNIGPVINTANRLDEEQVAFNLLTSKTNEELTLNLNSLINLNNIRKRTQKKLVDSLKTTIDFSKYKHSIAMKIETDININGNIASSLGESFKLPTICFNGDNEILKGSCRGILNSIHVLDVLNEIQKHDNTILIHFGGHKGAAGCAIHAHKFEEFRELFDTKCKEQISSSEEELIDIDMEVKNISSLYNYIDNINSLAPYGKDFKEPVFMSKFRLKGKFISNGFGKLFFRDSKGDSIEAKTFFRTQSADEIKMLGDDVDVEVVYNFNLSTYGGVNDYVMELIHVRRL